MNNQVKVRILICTGCVRQNENPTKFKIVKEPLLIQKQIIPNMKAPTLSFYEVKVWPKIFLKLIVVDHVSLKETKQKLIKGQLISKCLFGVIVLTKIATKIL